MTRSFLILLCLPLVVKADDYDAEAALALAAASQPQPKVTQPTVAQSYAPTIGHTHTCANGHTWDHNTNPTHTCQVCGLQQYIQDPYPRTMCVGGNCPTATYRVFPNAPWNRR